MLKESLEKCLKGQECNNCAFAHEGRMLLICRSLGEKICEVLDAEPVRRGTWVIKRTSFTQGHYECSECGYIDQHTPNYCPNCGAKMDKEE